MRLVTFQVDGGAERLGVLRDADTMIIDLQAAARAKEHVESPYFANMLVFLAGDVSAREKAQAVVEYAEGQRPPGIIIPSRSVRLLAPVPRPESIRDCLCFEQHIINCIRVVGLKWLAPADRLLERMLGRRCSIAYRVNKSWYERPVYYKGNRFSVVGTGAEVRMPVFTRMFDYELEWGIFISKPGADIRRQDARAHIGGYTIFNDFSARDVQLQEQRGRLGPAKGKDFDTGNAMGPCLVTPDEIDDPYDLLMTARVNGQEWSRGTTADMHWQFEDLVEYISQSETLWPGDFIGSGTCSGAQGCGCGLEMGRFLSAGDIVELEVQGIGVLANTVVAATASPPVDRPQ